MFRIWLTSLLAILIAMQSVLAVADVHRPLQSENQHLQFDSEHEHLSSTKSGDAEFADNNQSINQHTPSDCHHCCHCHSTATPALLQASLWGPAYADNARLQSRDQHSAINPPITAFYRPPKA